MLLFVVAVVFVGTPLLGETPYYWASFLISSYVGMSITSIAQLKAFNLPPQFRNGHRSNIGAFKQSGIVPKPTSLQFITQDCHKNDD